MDCDEDGEPCDCEAETKGNERGSKPRAIGEVGHDETEGKRCCGGWHGVKLGIDNRVAKCSYYRRCKVGKSLTMAVRFWNEGCCEKEGKPTIDWNHNCSKMSASTIIRLDSHKTYKNT